MEHNGFRKVLTSLLAVVLSLAMVAVYMPMGMVSVSAGSYQVQMGGNNNLTFYFHFINVSGAPGGVYDFVIDGATSGSTDYDLNGATMASVIVKDNKTGALVATLTPTYPAGMFGDSGTIALNGIINNSGTMHIGYAGPTVPPTPTPVSVPLTAEKNAVYADNSQYELHGGEFTFGVFDAPNGDAPLFTATNAANGVVLFSPSAPTTYTVDDVGQHNYIIKEIAGDDTNWTYDDKSWPVTVTVEQNFNVSNNTSTLTATVTYPTENPVFNNTYMPPPEPKVFTITIPKEVNGEPILGWANGKYSLDDLNEMMSFELRDKDDNKVADGTLDATGKIVFTPDVPAGYYTVVETLLSSGSFFNTAPTSLGITVDAGGKATVTSGGDDPAVFNTYSATGSIKLTATKVACGAGLIKDQFSFAVYDTKSANPVPPVATGENDADGNIMFTAIDYTLADVGTHTYKVMETTPSGSGWTCDRTVYTVTVTVTDNKNGTLSATVTDVTSSTNSAYKFTNDPNDAGNTGITFTNTYKAAPVSVKLLATKEAVGADMKAGQFSFQLSDESSKEIDTATNDATAAGDTDTVNFKEITYSKTGVYKYTIKETTQSGSGWTCDGTVFPVTVTVTDDENGKLQAKVEYTNGEPAFTNVYSADGSLTLVGLKVAKNSDGSLHTITAGEFGFAVFNTGDDTTDPSLAIATAQNDAYGRIIFPSISYKAAGTYNYTIVEDSPLPSGWAANGQQFNIAVTVADNGKGKLYVSKITGDLAVIFVNTYTPGEKAKVTLTATKVAKGADLTDGQFEFGVFNKDGSQEVYEADDKTPVTATNNADGTIKFPDITYTAADVGLHTYTVKETSTSGDGWTCDGTVFKVTVVVAIDRNGNLTATPIYPKDDIVFTNTYKAEPTSVVLTAKKVVLGEAAPALKDLAGKFHFIVRDSDGKLVATATNAADGSITFPDITCNSVGIFTYTISEVGPSAVTPADPPLVGWAYDATTYTVKVAVTDNGKGNLNAMAVYPNATGIKFTNTYSAAGTVVLTAKKAVTGTTLAAVTGKFNFIVKDSNGVVATATNDADGNIVFPAIPYTAAGTYSYTISEVGPTAVASANPIGGWVYDSAEYAVNVVVTDNGKGVLTAVAGYTNATGITFRNAYTASTASVALTATKAVTGFTGTMPVFNFTATDKDTGDVYYGTNDADGKITFETINYTLDDAGLHNYTIAEVNGGQSGWTYDSRTFTVAVNVTDNGKGTLEAMAVYPNVTGITFTNTYSEPPTGTTVGPGPTTTTAAPTTTTTTTTTAPTYSTTQPTTVGTGAPTSSAATTTVLPSTLAAGSETSSSDTSVSVVTTTATTVAAEPVSSTPDTTLPPPTLASGPSPTAAISYNAGTTAPASAPQTSETNPLVYIILGLASACILGVVVVSGRRRQRGDE